MGKIVFQENVLRQHDGFVGYVVGQGSEQCYQSLGFAKVTRGMIRSNVFYI
jgi:hypothetical protein